MKKFYLFYAFLLITTLYLFPVFAQNTVTTDTPTKIAFINTQAFDDKTGITKYSNAMNALETEFKPVDTELQTMVTKYQNLGTELQNLQKTVSATTANQTSYQTKLDEYGKLEREIKFKQEDAKARFQSRQTALLSPILQDIGKGIQDFAKLKGYTIIFDISKLAENDLLLALDDKADVTKEFIAYYNARPPAGAATPK